MALSPQAAVFAIQAVMRLGNAAKRAYQDHVLDESITLPNVDAAKLETPGRASQIVTSAIQNGKLAIGDWRADLDLIASNDVSPAGLAAQSRVIVAATELNPGFAAESELEAFAVLRQWSDEANRRSPLGRIGFELADIALDYVGSNPALFGADGNGAKLVTSVATSLAELLPDLDDPTARGSTFAVGAIRIFTEAGLRALDRNLDKLVDEAQMRDLVRSTLKPLIEAVANGDQGDQPWYDLRDEFLGPVAEAAIDALARNQAAILGASFEVSTKVGALTRSVLLAIKDKGLADDLGKEGLLRAYGAVLDTIIARPDVFLGRADRDADILTERLFVSAAKHVKQNSPPFDKALGSSLLALSFDVVGANASLLVGNIDAGDWTEALGDVGETLVREVSRGLAEGLRGGIHSRVLARVFTQDQAERLLRVIVEHVAAAPGLVVRGESVEARLLVAIVARAIASRPSVLLGSADWLAVAEIVAREVAANPGRLIRTDLGAAEEQLLFKLITAVLDAAAGAAADGRAGGNVVFGPTLVEALRTLVEAAAGNAAKALENIERVKALVTQLAHFVKEHKDRMGRREWLALFRHYVARVIDTGELPSFEPEDVFALLVEH